MARGTAFRYGLSAVNNEPACNGPNHRALMAPKKKIQAPSASLQKSFKSALKRATGRAEQVLVLFIDVRGFSSFSSSRDSVDIALYIRRLFLSLINKYFSRATFHKSTGDGMMVIYRYDEKNLKRLASEVIDAAIRLHVEFSGISEEDNMITFGAPDACGIGINRGTVCCIEADGETLDYAGHVLNLAARLQDLARPAGIVMHGSLGNLIPAEFEDVFETASVYVRGINENQPVPVYALKGVTSIPHSALQPPSDAWGTHSRKWTAAEVTQLGGRFAFEVPNLVKDKVQDVLCRFYTPGSLKGLRTIAEITDFTIKRVADKTEIFVDLKGIKAKCAAMDPKSEVALELKYRQ